MRAPLGGVKGSQGGPSTWQRHIIEKQDNAKLSFVQVSVADLQIR